MPAPSAKGQNAAGHWVPGLGAAAAMALVAVSVACGPAETSPPGYYGSVSYSSAGSSWGAGSSSSSAGAQPTVVVVDTDRVLTATPGQGVGVFTEYQTGGHWHVWWTCDTTVTGSSCDFQIAAWVSSGIDAISNVQTEGAALQSVVSATTREVTVSTVTSTILGGITFDAPAGASIELDARLNGARSGQFLFFVQDGIVNGGYKGQLSDPLVFSPSTP